MLSPESTTADVFRAKPALAILPLGATEQHGAHLPLFTDSLISERVAEAVAAELHALRLPVMPYSISQMHRGCHGTIWLRNQTLWRVLRDIAEGVIDSGIGALLILNSHGGNLLLQSVVQDLNMDFPHLLTFTLNSYEGVQETGLFGEMSGLVHADEFETSLVWHLRPDLIDPSLLTDNPSVIPIDALRYDPFPAVSRPTHTGRPTLASQENGRAAFDFMVRRTVESARRILATVAERRRKPPA